MRKKFMNFFLENNDAFVENNSLFLFLKKLVLHIKFITTTFFYKIYNIIYMRITYLNKYKLCYFQYLYL